MGWGEVGPGCSDDGVGAQGRPRRLPMAPRKLTGPVQDGGGGGGLPSSLLVSGADPPPSPEYNPTIAPAARRSCLSGASYWSLAGMRSAPSHRLDNCSKARHLIGLPRRLLGLAQVLFPFLLLLPPQGTTRQREGPRVNQEADVMLIGHTRPLFLNQLAGGRS